MDSSPSWRLVSLVITMMGTVVVRAWILKRRVNSKPLMEPASVIGLLMRAATVGLWLRSGGMRLNVAADGVATADASTGSGVLSPSSVP
ncbi:MAG: hypothetical protein ACM4AI_23995 [Acidobacteriota bacterium]